MDPVDTVRTVETPEGVLLRLRPAGPVARGAAYLIDLGLLWAAATVAVVLFTLLGSAGMGILAILAFLAIWLYPVLFEVLGGGRTPGKRVLNLRVLTADGLPLTWGPSLQRNLLRVVDGLPFGYTVGLVSLLLTRDARRVGDLVADTLVVHDPVKPVVVPLPEAEPLALPAVLTLEEQAALVSFAERSPLMSPARVAELADLLADLTGATGAEGARRLHGMAHTIRGTGAGALP